MCNSKSAWRWDFFFTSQISTQQILLVFKPVLIIYICLLVSFFFSVLTFAAWVVCWRIKFSTPRRFSAAKNIELAKREPKKIRNKIIKRIKNLSQQIIIFETSKKHFLTRAREKEWIYKREFVARVSTSFSRLRHWNHL